MFCDGQTVRELTLPPRSCCELWYSPELHPSIVLICDLLTKKEPRGTFRLISCYSRELALPSEDLLRVLTALAVRTRANRLDFPLFLLASIKHPPLSN